MKYLKLVWIVAAVGLLAGCTSLMDRRIAAHRETWQGLSEQDRSRLRQGHVLPGDTEGMVLIAYGPPDKVVPLTGPEGQEQMAWLYDLLDANYPSFDPDAIPRYVDRERSVVFHDGLVLGQQETGQRDFTATLRRSRAEATTEHMVERLDSLVALTLEQKLKAHEIFAKANEELFAFSLNERPMKGMPIRVKMRADIRALLNASQQARYDAAPQYLGGGSMKRP